MKQKAVDIRESSKYSTAFHHFILLLCVLQESHLLCSLYTPLLHSALALLQKLFHLLYSTANAPEVLP